MKSLLYSFQLSEFLKACNPAEFINIPEAGSPATALAGVVNQASLVDVSSIRAEQAVAL